MLATTWCLATGPTTVLARSMPSTTSSLSWPSCLQAWTGHASGGSNCHGVARRCIVGLQCALKRPAHYVHAHWQGLCMLVAQYMQLCGCLLPLLPVCTRCRAVWLSVWVAVAGLLIVTASSTCPPSTRMTPSLPCGSAAQSPQQQQCQQALTLQRRTAPWTLSRQRGAQQHPPQQQQPAACGSAAGLRRPKQVHQTAPVAAASAGAQPLVQWVVSRSPSSVWRQLRSSRRKMSSAAASCAGMHGVSSGPCSSRDLQQMDIHICWRAGCCSVATVTDC
jgi:hypothetical protein